MMHRVVALSMLAGAAVLLYLAAPRAVAAIVALPTDHLIAHVLNGDALSSNDLQQLLATRKRVLELEQSEDRYGELALAAFLEAETLYDAGDIESSKVRVEQTVQLSRDGLALAPARPFSWTRLAYAEIVRDPTSVGAAAALEMSLRTAPYDPLLTFIRLELGLRAWDVLDDEQKRLVRDQIDIAWRQSADTLVNIATLTEQIDLVRDALPVTAGSRERFEQLLHDATQPTDLLEPGG